MSCGGEFLQQSSVFVYLYMHIFKTCSCIVLVMVSNDGSIFFHFFLESIQLKLYFFYFP